MTRKTIRDYFDALAKGGNWQAFLADGMRFASHATPSKEVAGKETYIESTKGFYSMIRSLEVKNLIVDGDRACAVTRYWLEPPKGEPFTCDVAELFSVEGDKIDSFDIYFDSAPFPGPAAP